MPKEISDETLEIAQRFVRAMLRERGPHWRDIKKTEPKEGERCLYERRCTIFGVGETCAGRRFLGRDGFTDFEDVVHWLPTKELLDLPVGP